MGSGKKLLSFGVHRVIQTYTQYFTSYGTIAYMDRWDIFWK